MKKTYDWLIAHGYLLAAVAVVLLVVACGPQMATPTSEVVPGGQEPTPRVTEVVSTVPATETAELQPPDYSKLQVDANDWRTLGWPDAPVTIVEYSDFQ